MHAGTIKRIQLAAVKYNRELVAKVKRKGEAAPTHGCGVEGGSGGNVICIHRQKCWVGANSHDQEGIPFLPTA
jgi:hypothetical protein